MPSPSDVAELRAANQTLENRALRDLTGYWSSLDLSMPENARDALLRYIPTLTTVYGSAAAVVAADWYDSVRAADGVGGRFAAEVADVFPPEGMVAQVRFSAGHLFTPTPDQMLAFLAGSVQKHALQPGRDTITRSTLADPAAKGWQRHTRGEACGFCRMLAGRGAVYTASTADFTAHGKCHCVALPAWA